MYGYANTAQRLDIHASSPANTARWSIGPPRVRDTLACGALVQEQSWAAHDAARISRDIGLDQNRSHRDLPRVGFGRVNIGAAGGFPAQAQALQSTGAWCWVRSAVEVTPGELDLGWHLLGPQRPIRGHLVDGPKPHSHSAYPEKKGGAQCPDCNSFPPLHVEIIRGRPWEVNMSDPGPWHAIDQCREENCGFRQSYPTVNQPPFPTNSHIAPANCAVDPGWSSTDFFG